MNRISTNIIDPFHKSLYNVIASKADDKIQLLSDGHAASFDEYKMYVGYLQALKDVITWASELELDRYGKREN